MPGKSDAPRSRRENSSLPAHRRFGVRRESCLLAQARRFQSRGIPDRMDRQNWFEGHAKLDAELRGDGAVGHSPANVLFATLQMVRAAAAAGSMALQETPGAADYGAILSCWPRKILAPRQSRRRTFHCATKSSLSSKHRAPDSGSPRFGFIFCLSRNNQCCALLISGSALLSFHSRLVCSSTAGTTWGTWKTTNSTHARATSSSVPAAHASNSAAYRGSFSLFISRVARL